MGASQSQLCEENSGFGPQNRWSDSEGAEKITGARLSDVKTAVGDLGTKEPQQPSEARAIMIAERTEILPRSAATTMAGKKEEMKLPYNLKAILKKADSSVDWSSTDKLFAQLYAGVLLSRKRKKFWVDKKSNKNCYKLFARDLSITWAEDNRYWKWQSVREITSDVLIDVAELLDVCWLEVHGQLNATKLSPETLYEVVFVVMLKDPGYGWEVPVNLRLTLPNGIKHEHKENLMAKPRGQWIEIPVGEFKTTSTNTGKIELSMYEYEGGDWKRGLVINGAVIRPKN